MYRQESSEDPREHNYSYPGDFIYMHDFPTWEEAIAQALQFAKHPQAWKKPSVFKRRPGWCVEVEHRP